MRAAHRFRPRVEALGGRVLLSAIPPRTSAAAQAANTPPVILGATELIQGRAVVAFEVQFTKPVDAAPLSDLAHYALFDQSRRNPFGGSAVPLASATYLPAGEMLILTPAVPLPPAPYLLTSANPADRSTDFITDAQGRPLLTASREFDVYFLPHGFPLRNLVLTDSPIINQETGASLLASTLALARSTRRSINRDQYGIIVHGGILGGGLASALLLRALP